jgi:Flp pilus assembly protein TadG
LARRWGPREDGGAAVEFAIWLAVLAPAMIGAIDIGLYGYQRVQVANAAQALAQAVFTASTKAGCTYSTSNGPTSSNCSALTTSFKNNAINGSSSLAASGQITENAGGETYGYYCVNSTTGALVSNASASTPGTCSASGVIAGTAGYYYKVEVKFTYAPLFGGISVASILGTSIIQDSWIRLQ